MDRDSQMSYLQAIQKIPGDTAGEKLSWIGRLALHETSEDLEQLPPELLPLLRVEIAVKKKRHEDIASALKCEDLTIINRALKASWFFDGSHKEIVDVAYFCERLFPYVSINTRTRIVITLAHRLSGKDPIFAQQMFTAMASIYDIQTVYPLFMACDETFAYETIVEKRLVLPVEIVRKIFRKNPNLVVRFLKLLKPVQNATERIPFATECTPFAIGIDRYKSFLPKLIKKRVEDFVELYETHLPNIVLSNTCAELFLKKARQHLIKKPLTYICILPLKTINAHLMESIFPGMLPEEISSFSTDTMLNYLKHYPRDKKYELLRKSYKNKYNADLLDDTRNVTPDLLRVLSAEERIKQARIKIEKEDASSNPENYETAWICYLPVNEAIPAIKEKINKTAEERDRLGFIKQMIYVCKINEDDDALYDTLVYFLNRHKNENGYIFEEMFQTLLIIYDVPHLNEKQASLVMEIVRLFHIKNKFTPEDILLAMIHFRLIHGMPIEDLINIFLENNTYINFNILTEYPQYERRCLVTFANLIRNKSFRNLKDRKKYNFKFVQAIYNFNTRWKKSSIKIEKMTITDYPWLVDIILEMREEDEYPLSIKALLQLHEPILHQLWFPDSIMKVTSGAALAVLKRNLPNILNNWEQYLEDSMENHYYKQVQHFIRAMRWYNDLPIKFAECCMDYVFYKKHRNKISSSIAILANLLHGDAVTKLIDPFMPTETRIDTSYPNYAQSNYNIVQDLSLSMRLSNPPISLDLVIKLCKGDYLSIALMTLTNISRRTSLPKVISTAQKLISMRVSVRKHGIRLMSFASKQLSFHELINFYQKTWSTEKHYSIRQVLFEEIQRLFLTNPRFETWSLYCQIVSMLNLDDEALLSKMMPLSISNEYVVKYLDLRLKTIDNFQEMGLDIKKINGHIAQYLTMLLDVFNFLSEEFAENILRRFLFHVDTDISNKANSFAIWYISENISKDKQEARFKVFAELFRNSVTYCNMPQSLEKFFYPVNKTVCSFINDFVIIYVSNYFRSNMSVNPQVVDNMQILFSSVLSPTEDAWSYLLLVYTKKFQECKESSSMKSFGLRIGQHLPHLIDIFSSPLLSFMAEVLEYFLKIFERYVKSIEYEEFKLSIIEGLIEAGNTDSCFMAAIMLPSTIQWASEHMARYNQLIGKFRGMKEPAITTVLYNHFRNKSF